MPQRELLQLFPIPVLITKYEQDFSRELEYVKGLDHNLNSLAAQKIYGKQSTDTFLLDKPELKNIRAFIELQIDFYIKNIMQSSNKLQITQSWTNISEKGRSHHLHYHPNSLISGVFYFQINKNLPPIEFRNKNSELYSLKINKFNNFNSESFLLPLDSGELILFPSMLYHSVPENFSDIPRISLSFNTFETESLGKIESLTYLPLKR